MQKRNFEGSEDMLPSHCWWGQLLGRAWASQEFLTELSVAKNEIRIFFFLTYGLLSVGDLSGSDSDSDSSKAYLLCSVILGRRC